MVLDCLYDWGNGYFNTTLKSKQYWHLLKQLQYESLDHGSNSRVPVRV